LRGRPLTSHACAQPLLNPALLTASELAEHLRVNQSWVYEHSHQVGFPVVRVGRYLRFRLADVEDWLSEQASSNA